MLPDRLTKIDETTRDQHHFLDPDDHCYFFGDFHSRQGFRFGETNQLIANYKRRPMAIRASPKARELHYYKEQAIRDVAAALRTAISGRTLAETTFVPIATSRVRTHPDYCDRLERTLRAAFGDALDLRCLLRQTVSTEADHLRDLRSSYDALLEITELDRAQLTTPVRDRIILFDDVLTSGKHYKVAKTRLLEALPGHAIVAIFIARAIHPSDRATGAEAPK
ncbi:MAG: hypothetical protein ACREU3_00205 [Steroidobacteraceae bacterium]